MQMTDDEAAILNLLSKKMTFAEIAAELGQSYSFKVFLIPKIGASRSADDLAIEFIRYDPGSREGMSRYERVVALIKPKHVNVTNMNGLKPGGVVASVAAQLDRKFTQHTHGLCWKYFKARPSYGSPDLCWL
jgi:hypothetical protein